MNTLKILQNHTIFDRIVGWTYGYFLAVSAKIVVMENSLYKKPVILCVGTVNVTGDSVGPKIGDRLVEKGVDAYVYGKSARPVNGVNYEKYVDFIKTHHPEGIVVAVDACLGKKEDVGKIKFTLNGLRAGAALKKRLTSFGDISILVIVGEKSNDNFKALLDADEAFIENLAEKTAEKIYNLTEDLRLYYIKEHKIQKPIVL